jgi:hypothetical protein
MIGGSRKMLEGKLYRYLILVCAALLAGFGVWFVSSGMGTIVSRLAE